MQAKFGYMSIGLRNWGFETGFSDFLCLFLSVKRKQREISRNRLKSIDVTDHSDIDITYVYSI